MSCNCLSVSTGYTYDGNGNVSEVIDASDGTVAAHYEYDAYGRELVADGSYADTNPFRFSTKPATNLNRVTLEQ